jgi:hypothetical protein
MSIIKLFDNPNWALRSPDQQKVMPPEAPLPIKQGGIPSPVGANPPPKAPGKINPAAVGKAADAMLRGTEPQGSAAPSGIPGQETAVSSLSNALKMRRLSRQSAQQQPCSIGYMTGGV